MAALTPSDVGAIVKAVGLEVKVDEGALLNDLDWSESWFCGRRMAEGDRALRGSFEKIEAAALKLSRLLNRDVQASLGISDDQRAAVNLIAKVTDRKLRPPVDTVETKIDQELGIALGADRLSAFEWLAGERLPAVFKKHFNEDAGYTRNQYSEKTDSPYIRFVISSLAALSITNNGRPYSADSIARALTGGGSRRTRRKPKGRKS